MENQSHQTTATVVRPFRVDMPEEAVADLRRRIAATRWPSRELVTDRSQGVQLATLQALARYWATDHDWRKTEAKLNALPQFKTEIDGVDIHFIHVRSRHENALPLIITHGWPGSVIELLETVGPLTDPTAHGGNAEDAFHLVLPSVPGYGFSGESTELGWDAGRTARAWAELMRRLGYTRYVAQGGDVGAAISDAMGRQAPEGLIGIAAILVWWRTCPVQDSECNSGCKCASSSVRTLTVPARSRRERVPAFVEPWAQTTVRLRQALQALGTATCGELGMRLAAHLGIQTSPTTILRRIMALPSAPVEAVSHLGIDDFALRRGRNYGTVLVDLQRHQVIDLLSDRKAETAKAWIRAHPEIKLVSRDRAGDYATAAREASSPSGSDR